MNKCIDCTYYKRLKIGVGHCRRFPPISHDEVSWPKVYYGDWCGEFSASDSNMLDVLNDIADDLHGISRWD